MALHLRRTDGDLARLAFFEGWPEDELEHFQRVATRSAFRQGDALIREGATGHSFTVLLAGEAEVSQDGRRIRTLRAGDHCGELALLDDLPASASVVASQPVEALLLSQDDFYNLLETVPSLGRRILRTLARWFRASQGNPS
jgi:ATP-binding cassette, subfamily B, bacterial